MSSRFRSLIEHDLFGKPLHTFPDHALALGAEFAPVELFLEQVVFSEGKCVASATSVGVLLEEVSRRPTQLTAEVIEKLRPWHKRGITVAPPDIAR